MSDSKTSLLVLSTLLLDLTISVATKLSSTIQNIPDRYCHYPVSGRSTNHNQTNPSQTNVPSCRLGTKRKGQTSTLAGRTMISEAILRTNTSHPQVKDKRLEWVHSMQRITLFESSRPPPPMRIVVLIVGLVDSVLWRNHSAEVGGWSRSETPFPSRILTRKVVVLLRVKYIEWARNKMDGMTVGDSGEGEAIYRQPAPWKVSLIGQLKLNA